MRYRHFRKLTAKNREHLGEILAVFRWKYVKPQSTVTAKHTFQKLVSILANQKFVVFVDELQMLAKSAFGIAAHAFIEQFIYDKKATRSEKINKPGPFGERHV